MNPFKPLVATLMALLLLSGCNNKNSWLKGDWVFDREHTESQMGSEEPGLLGGLLSSQLIEELDGVSLTLTADEMFYILANGSGKARNYEVISQPTESSWKIKIDDGSIETWHREGERLASNATGDLDMRFYFSRVED